MKKLEKGVYPLKGAVQNYAWGGDSYIPDLIGMEAEDGKTYAEYWVGTHDRGAGRIKVNGEWKDLRDYVQLKYLLKILDVADMLSIQAHPNKEEAEIGFKKENAEGKDIKAFDRIFRDDNHKPELMMALGEFWLLHGFKSIDDLRDTLSSTVELANLAPLLSQGIQHLYSTVMQYSDEEIKKHLTPLRDQLEKENPSDKDHPDYWALRAFKKYGFDRGIYSIYLYNLVHLQPGQCIYQEAGIPHAYLEGQNVELMANSDNVFRAGLTPKYMNVEVLLKHLDFSSVVPNILEPTMMKEHLSYYPTPATEFELYTIDLDAEQGVSISTDHPECFILLKGTAAALYGDSALPLTRGDCFYVTSDTEIEIQCAESAMFARAINPMISQA